MVFMTFRPVFPGLLSSNSKLLLYYNEKNLLVEDYDPELWEVSYYAAIAYSGNAPLNKDNNNNNIENEENSGRGILIFRLQKHTYYPKISIHNTAILNRRPKICCNRALMFSHQPVWPVLLHKPLPACSFQNRAGAQQTGVYPAPATHTAWQPSDS